jgi:hypothetical protein
VPTGDRYLTKAIKRGYYENVNGRAPGLVDINGAKRWREDARRKM